MNYSNLQNLTNYIQVSPQFEHLPFLLLRVNIPGITASVEQISTRGRNRFHIAQDLMEFNQLSFEMLIDEDLKIWLEMQNYLRDRLKRDGTFDDSPFEFILQINNNKGNKLFNIVFESCRLNSIGDIQLDTTSSQTNHTLQVEISYDQYEIVYETEGGHDDFRDWIRSCQTEPEKECFNPFDCGGCGTCGKQNS